MRQTNKTCFSCLTHQVILILVQASMFHLCSKFLLLIEAEIHTYVVTRFHNIVTESIFNIVGLRLATRDHGIRSVSEPDYRNFFDSNFAIFYRNFYME